jgi:hypothetical protein
MGNDNFGSSQRTRRRATGVSTLRSIAGELTRRGIPTAGGRGQRVSREVAGGVMSLSSRIEPAYQLRCAGACPLGSGKTETKMALILSTPGFCQLSRRRRSLKTSFSNPSAYGNADATAATVPPVDGGITASDWGYQGASRQDCSRTGR